jgi:hypothetical protein
MRRAAIAAEIQRGCRLEAQLELDAARACAERALALDGANEAARDLLAAVDRDEEWGWQVSYNIAVAKVLAGDGQRAAAIGRLQRTIAAAKRCRHTKLDTHEAEVLLADLLLADRLERE